MTAGRRDWSCVDLRQPTAAALARKYEGPRLAAPAFAVSGDRCDQWPPARIASNKIATMLMILIIGFTAGPAVSL
jgi:hypothetical protein